MDYRYLNKKVLSDWFDRFAKNECQGVSNLYYQLSIAVSQDADLLGIAAHCQQRQPMPNLFFAAVHYLLLKNPNNSLANYYPSINTSAKLPIPFELFKDFCLSNTIAIKTILKTKIVQTNALNRAAYLMPAISSLFTEKETINLIDIGTSAGLTMNWDLYEYHYNDQLKFGKSPVKINSKIKKGELPTFPKIASVNKKIGIDQHPLDIRQKENALWLKALIWADRKERFERIKQAILLAQHSTIDLRKASKVNEFEDIIMQQEKSSPLVVYHTHALYQFTKEERAAFRSMLERVAQHRDFYYLAVEAGKILANDYGRSGFLAELTHFKNKEKKSRLIAETNGHANWIKWEN